MNLCWSSNPLISVTSSCSSGWFFVFLWILLVHFCDSSLASGLLVSSTCLHVSLPFCPWFVRLCVCVSVTFPVLFWQSLTVTLSSCVPSCVFKASCCMLLCVLCLCSFFSYWIWQSVWERSNKGVTLLKIMNIPPWNSHVGSTRLISVQVFAGQGLFSPSAAVHMCMKTITSYSVTCLLYSFIVGQS